jgi:hypothetical protein
MWIFTEIGFISVVRKKDRPDVLTVRSRDRISLEKLATLTGQDIARSPKGDYPYRIFVDEQVLAEFMKQQVLSIEYDNFKTRVGQVRGYSYVHQLHEVWDAMRHTEDAGARTVYQKDDQGRMPVAMKYFAFNHDDDKVLDGYCHLGEEDELRFSYPETFDEWRFEEVYDINPELIDPRPE